jgi:hypothetical protein
MWHADPLLGNDPETNNYTTSATRQRSVKSNRGTMFSERFLPITVHATVEYVIPLLSNYCTATIEYNNNVKRCFLRGPRQDVLSRTSLEHLQQQETQGTGL